MDSSSSTGTATTGCWSGYWSSTRRMRARAGTSCYDDDQATSGLSFILTFIGIRLSMRHLMKLLIVVHLAGIFPAGHASEMTIVVPEVCPAGRLTVARDLAATLGRMTGSRPTLVTGSERPDGPAILLGDEFAPAAIRTELTEQRIGFDGYLIRSLDAQTLLLCGRREGGHSNAVYGWLRELGCRWFMPGPHGEVIPTVDKLVLDNWNRLEKPGYIHRDLWYSTLGTVRKSAPQDAAACTAELADWKRRNRMGGAPVHFSHNYAYVVPAKVFFAEHPEFFPLRDGRRVSDGQLCTTNEEVIDLFAKAAIAAFDDNPDLKSFSLSPNDGAGWCHCAKCEALDPPKARGTEHGKADRVVTFVNAVAKQVKKKHPNRWLAFYAYAGCVAFPTHSDPDDNVLVVLAHYVFDHLRGIADPNSSANSTFNSYVDGWSAVAEQLFVREYYCRWWAPWPMWPAVGEDIPYLSRRHFSGFNAELEYRAEGCEIGWYLLAELAWHPEQNPDSLADTYFRGLYGPAAREMRTYFSILREAEGDSSLRARGGLDEISQLFPRNRLTRAREVLETARVKVGTESQRFQVQRSIDAMDLLLAGDDLITAKAVFDAAGDVPSAKSAKVAYEKAAAVNARIRNYDLARYWSTAPMLKSMLEGPSIALGEKTIDPWKGDFRSDSFGQKFVSFARMVQSDGLGWSNSVDDGYVYGNGRVAAWYIRHDKPIEHCQVTAFGYDNAESAGWWEWRLSFDRGRTWKTVERVDSNQWRSHRLDLTKHVVGRQDFVLGVYFAPGANTRARVSTLSVTIE